MGRLARHGSWGPSRSGSAVALRTRNRWIGNVRAAAAVLVAALFSAWTPAARALTFPPGQATILGSVTWDGSPADGKSFESALSGDGQYLALVSAATNMVPDDTNGV